MQTEIEKKKEEINSLIVKSKIENLESHIWSSTPNELKTKKRKWKYPITALIDEYIFQCETEQW